MIIIYVYASREGKEAAELNSGPLEGLKDLNLLLEIKQGFVLACRQPAECSG
jgi:hypothetical protein